MALINGVPIFFSFFLCFALIECRQLDIWSSGRNFAFKSTHPVISKSQISIKKYIQNESFFSFWQMFCLRNLMLLLIFWKRQFQRIITTTTMTTTPTMTATTTTTTGMKDWLFFVCRRFRAPWRRWRVCTWKPWPVPGFEEFQKIEIPLVLYSFRKITNKSLLGGRIFCFVYRCKIILRFIYFLSFNFLTFHISCPWRLQLLSLLFKPQKNRESRIESRKLFFFGKCNNSMIALFLLGNNVFKSNLDIRLKERKKCTKLYLQQQLLQKTGPLNSLIANYRNADYLAAIFTKLTHTPTKDAKSIACLVCISYFITKLTKLN